MIKVGILGATGYIGCELTRLLLMHPYAKIERLISHSQAGLSLNETYPGFSGCGLPPLEALSARPLECDVVFAALPHGTSEDVIPDLVSAGIKVIDMSADYRYDDADVYKAWYGVAHPSPGLLSRSVYGLPELHKDKIRQADLIGNPGCYTTCSILALAPLMKHHLIDVKSVIIDAKSGATGAGRAMSQDMQFCEVNGNLKAYKVASHRHTSEIEQELSKLFGSQITVSFTPHLLPVGRGILSTCYAGLSEKCGADELYGLYRDFYGDAPFVKIGGLPELKHVVGSNFCAIGLVVDERTGRVVVVSCIDNLIKGAAGQGIQNMNLLFSLQETAGLTMPPWQI